MSGSVGGRSGDGFLRCSDGAVRWGVFGAAGVVFVLRDVDGRRVQSVSGGAHWGGGMLISARDQARLGLLMARRGRSASARSRTNSTLAADMLPYSASTARA